MENGTVFGVEFIYIAIINLIFSVVSGIILIKIKRKKRAEDVIFARIRGIDKKIEEIEKELEVHLGWHDGVKNGREGG